MHPAPHRPARHPQATQGIRLLRSLHPLYRSDDGAAGWERVLSAGSGFSDHQALWPIHATAGPVVYAQASYLAPYITARTMGGPGRAVGP